MATRTVTATILTPSGDPWGGFTVDFTLRPSTYGEDATYPERKLSKTTDDDGTFSVELVTGVKYEVSYPEVSVWYGGYASQPAGSKYTIVVPDGVGSIALETLQTASVAPTTPSVITLIDSAVAPVQESVESLDTRLTTLDAGLATKADATRVDAVEAPGWVTSGRLAPNAVGRAALDASVAAYLPHAPRCAFLGDSITAADEGQFEGANRGGAWCYQTWLTWYSGGAVIPTKPSADNKVTSNHGVSGERSDQILARVPNVIAVKPDYCFVLAGTNDAGQAIPIATYAANMSAIIANLIKGGVIPIVVSPPPHNTPASAALLNKYCAWLQLYCRKVGVRYVDIWPVTANPLNGAWQSGLDRGDGVHPSALGASAIGKAVALAVKDVFPINPYLTSTVTDTANLWANGVFVGDSNSDGLANGWSQSNSPTTTLESADVGQKQVLDIGGKVGATIWQMAATGFAPGDLIATVGVFSLTNPVSPDANTGPSIRVEFNGVSNQSMSPVWRLVAPVDRGVWYREGVVPVGCSGIRIFVGAANASTTGIFRVERATLLNLTALGIA